MKREIVVFDLGGVLINLNVGRCMRAFEVLMGEANMRAVLGMDVRCWMSYLPRRGDFRPLDHFCLYRRFRRKLCLKNMPSKLFTIMLIFKKKKAKNVISLLKNNSC